MKQSKINWEHAKLIFMKRNKNLYPASLKFSLSDLYDPSKKWTEYFMNLFLQPVLLASRVTFVGKIKLPHDIYKVFIVIDIFIFQKNKAVAGDYICQTTQCISCCPLSANTHV